MKHASKILSAFLFPILVSLAHLIVRDGLHLYVRRPSIDLPFHYIGGFSIVYTASLILSRLESEKMIAPLNKIIFVILLLSLTATTAVVWEFAEFISDQVLRTHLQPSIANTIQDQFLGILGGGTWALIYSLREANAKTPILGGFVRSVSEKD